MKNENKREKFKGERNSNNEATSDKGDKKMEIKRNWIDIVRNKGRVKGFFYVCCRLCGFPCVSVPC